MIKFLSLLIITFTLFGCGSFRVEEKIVYKTNTVYIDVPSTLLELPDVPKPPNKEDYLKSTYEQKENILIDYSVELLKSLKKYKDRLIEIKDYISNQKKE